MVNHGNKQGLGNRLPGYQQSHCGLSDDPITMERSTIFNGKTHYWLGKSTYKCASFNSKLLVYRPLCIIIMTCCGTNQKNILNELLWKKNIDDPINWT